MTQTKKTLPDSQQQTKKTVLEMARQCRKRSEDRDSEARDRWRDDMLFALGEQWPAEVLTARSDPVAPRPVVTINTLPTHIGQVINDAKQNRPAIKVRPFDSYADVEVAEILDGVISHIEDSSDSDIAYETAMGHAVTGGFGWFRILTEVVDEELNYQEPRIRPVYAPLTVYPDANSMCPVGSDMRECLIAVEVPRAQFEEEFPGQQPWTEDDSERHDADGETVIVAEYFRLEGGKCKWYKLGSEILEESEFPSRYIPLIRVPGRITDVDGQRYYVGLVRDAVGPSRALNYMWSAAVEAIALQPKAPWLVAEGQDEGYEDEWDAAHVGNVGRLHYRTRDLEGNPIGAPQRQMPPQAPSGIITGVQMAQDAVKQVTGQWNESLGMASNAKSGRAILARQREGDVATYHFVDGLSKAIRHCGRILVDMIPRLYDTQRIVRVIGSDGAASTARFDPSIPAATMQVEEAGRVVDIYNPGVGRYDVTITVGPSYTTKRQEGVEAMTQILQGNPALIQTIGDLFFRAQDWPGADDIAERMKKMLPPQLAEDEEGQQPQIPPQVQQAMAQMQQQMQAMNAYAKKMEEMNAQLQSQLKEKQSAIQADAQAKLMEAQIEAQTDLEAAKIKAQADIQKARIAAAAKAMSDRDAAAIAENAELVGGDVGEVPRIPEQIDHLAAAMVQNAARMEEVLSRLVQQSADLQAIVSAPRELILDSDGMPVGSRPLMN